jgi:hypothetical protein
MNNDYENSFNEITKTLRAKRKEYMDNKISHHDYYIWLANLIGANKSYIPVSKETLFKSTDKYFNDIPMKLWDDKHPLILQLIRSKHIQYWSNSDTVCVLKALARDLINQPNRID